MSAWCRKGLLDSNLQAVQDPNNAIVSIMQKSPCGPWLTSCSKPSLLSVSCRKGLLEPDLHPDQNPDHYIVSIIQKRIPWPWLTFWSKPKQSLCQHNAKKAFWTLTHILFKTHSTLLSASCKKGLLDPDLHPVHAQGQPIVSIKQKSLLDPDLHPDQNSNHSIVSIMQKRPPVIWLTSCWKQSTHCQHHVEKVFWTLTYILVKTQSSLMSASFIEGLLDPDLHSVKNPDHSIVSIMQKRIPEA